LRAIQDFARQTQTVELLFVDDGSRDDTLSLLQHLQSRNPTRCQVLQLKPNGGKAEAVRQGILQAIELKPDYIGFWDADLATPLADIEAFCSVLADKPHVELVMGTRLRLLGHKIERRPVRYWLGRVFATAASWTLSLRIFDTQCGAKMFRVTPGLAELFAQRFLTRWIFDVEILARMQQRRRHGQASLAEALYEFPLDAWREVGGSTLKSMDFLQAIFEMAKICWRYRLAAADLPPSLPAPAHDQPSVPARGERRKNQQRAA
jgi:glycosyltransferase involved in cell wall biosynthesis